MLRRRLSRLAFWTLGITGLLASAQTAQAEFFEYTASVTISTTPGSFDPAGSTITNPPGNLTSTIATGNNTVTLSALKSVVTPPHLNGEIGTDITPLGIDASSGLGAVNEPLAFDFTLTLTITNYDTISSLVPGGIGTISFSGRIGGTLGNGAVNLDLLSFAPSPQNVTIDQETYTFSFNNYGSPGLDNNGALSLHVISVRSVPEPGSLALILMGIGGAVGIQRRRARASA